MTRYKRLTPQLRKGLIKKINNRISELQEREDDSLAKEQITELKATKNLIRDLPDGYPLPMKE